MKHIFLILAFFLAMSSSAFSFERTQLIYSTHEYQLYHVTSDHYNMVHFDGALTMMSAFFIIMALESNNSVYLSMNSPGGFMNESYQLGRYLTANTDITVVVRNNNICISACAFAALGATNLMIGKNGLEFHTPYMPYIDTNLTLNDFSLRSQIFLLQLSEYFDDCGYGHDLLNVILENSSRTEFVVFHHLENLRHFQVENFFDEVLLSNNDQLYTIFAR